MAGLSILRRAARGGLVLLGGLGLAGCGGDPAPPPAPPPATVQAIPGSPVHRVVLTEAGRSSLQLRTDLVREVDGHTVLPMTAIVYDPRGVPWTYLVVSPLTYVRQPVVIAGVTDGSATVTSGPPPGSAVVTVGAPELLGAEYGVGEE